MNHLPKELFFAVWDLPELRALIRSFMWPGRQSVTWYEYSNGDAAIVNGYDALLLQRTPQLSFSKNCLYMIVTSGRHVQLIDSIIRCGMSQTNCKMFSVVSLVNDTHLARKMLTTIKGASDLVFYAQKCSNSLFTLLFDLIRREGSRQAWSALVGLATTPDQVERLVEAYDDPADLKIQVLINALADTKISIIDWFVRDPTFVGERVQEELLSYGRTDVVMALYQKGMCVPCLGILKQYCIHRLFVMVNKLVYTSAGVANKYCMAAAQYCYDSGSEREYFIYLDDALSAGCAPFL